MFAFAFSHLLIKMRVISVINQGHVYPLIVYLRMSITRPHDIRFIRFVFITCDLNDQVRDKYLYFLIWQSWIPLTEQYYFYKHDSYTHTPYSQRSRAVVAANFVITASNVCFSIRYSVFLVASFSGTYGTIVRQSTFGRCTLVQLTSFFIYCSVQNGSLWCLL